MLLILLIICTVGGVIWLFTLGRKGAATTMTNGLAGGLGAAVGISWKFLLGFNNAGFVIETAFLAGGILLMFGALSYGRSLHTQRSQIKPETFE